MQYVLWQLADSGFPSGGFAHSSGLEASFQHGRVTDIDDVRAFAEETIAQAARGALPLVTAAHVDTGRLAELDRLCDVFLSNPVANRASRAQGRALVTSTARSFPESEIKDVDDRIKREGLSGHYAPVFGVVLRQLDVNLLDAQRLFVFLSVRSVASAAVRLGIIGGYDAQQLQSSLGRAIDAAVADYGTLDPLEIAHPSPILDLCQSTHDRLYSRLFQS